MAESGVLEVDRVTDMQAPCFLEKYYAANEPVVLAGFLASWPACGKWSPAYFAERHGDVAIEVMAGLDSNPHYQQEQSRSRRAMRMRDFVALVESDADSGNHYLVAQNQALCQPELASLWDDLRLDSDFLDPGSRSTKVSLWFGPANTVTPLHFDQQNALLAQVYGRKRVTFFSPAETGRLYNTRGGYSDVDPERQDLDRFPLFGQAVPRRAEIAPGDALFIPLGWWHHVRALSASISLSLSNFAWPNPFP